ncbi:MSHA biogenesis protein MshI [Gilvimarinus polysaccharolyticus]|uniref:MSHA biogenesis protein MshI n=1 Tax=Gilvimarinus polysaccharolyticus TaxID=863921 RepID=UPI000AFD8511|nr:MSHA biogenesis protein MshI [Gilvimarinus polysaccharolyticus]
MKFIRTKSRKYETLGVEFTPQGVAFALLERIAGQLPRLITAEFIPDTETPVVALRERLAKLDGRSAPCNLVMPAAGYQLLLGDAPDVPINELSEALRWRVKDLVSFPVVDAIVQAFLLPESCTRGGTRLAYAAVAKRSVVSEQVALAHEGGLALQAIDIPELALSQLALACLDTSRAVGLVHLIPGGGTLLLIREGELYLARNFTLDFNGGLLDDLPADALVLELQRSLDYFERQMRQVPPANIYLCGENITDDKITPSLKGGLAARVELLPLSQGLSIADDIEPHTLPLCLHAIGAALAEGGVR